jgi:Ca2+-binding EF-hand superfamily protein
MTKLPLAAALIGLASAAVAQPPAPPTAPAAPAADGVSFDAWAVRARERLMARDTNHDGKISKDEMAAAGGMGRRPADAPAGGAEAPRGPSRMFERMDANQDGYLDTAEINAMLARRFARMDANHDGVLTADERGAMRGMNAPGQ